MRATFLLSMLMLSGAISTLSCEEIEPWKDSTYQTLAVIIVIAWVMDIVDLFKPRSG